MSYGFGKTLSIFIICLMILTGCGNVEEEVTVEISEAGNMDKVLFYVTVSHNHQNKRYIDKDIMYYFVVQNDGTVWTMDCNYMEDNYEWVKKFSCHDESAWETANHIENIGSLSLEETKLLAEYISEIDYNSEDYDRLRDDGVEPEVIETIYYNYYCVIPDNKSKWFSIMHRGGQQGISYQTYDENALLAVKLITDSQLYIDWTEKIYKTN